MKKKKVITAKKFKKLKKEALKRKLFSKRRLKKFGKESVNKKPTILDEGWENIDSSTQSSSTICRQSNIAGLTAIGFFIFVLSPEKKIEPLLLISGFFFFLALLFDLFQYSVNTYCFRKWTDWAEDHWEKGGQLPSGWPEGLLVWGTWLFRIKIFLTIIGFLLFFSHFIVWGISPPPTKSLVASQEDIFFHRSDCPHAGSVLKSPKHIEFEKITEAEEYGYEPCPVCLKQLRKKWLRENNISETPILDQPKEEDKILDKSLKTKQPQSAPAFQPEI